MNKEKKGNTTSLKKIETRSYLPEAIVGALILVAFFLLLLIVIR